MRFPAYALAALAALSFVSLTAEPVQAVGICAYNDVYNNMGGPGSECEGVACVGYTSQTGWQTCVPPPIYCVTDPCPMSTAAADPVPPLCVGTLYNNQAGQPSSGCDGVACLGFADGDWHTCVLDCTTCAAPAAQVAVCVIGDAYNTGGSRCEGVACTGWSSHSGWQTCYPELGPCWPTCPPPPPRFL